MGDIDYSLTIRRWRKEDPEGFGEAINDGFTDADLEYFKGIERVQKLFADAINRPTETE